MLLAGMKSRVGREYKVRVGYDVLVMIRKRRGERELTVCTSTLAHPVYSTMLPLRKLAAIVSVWVSFTQYAV